MMATCAVLEEDRLLGEYSLNQKMSSSESLVPMIKEMLDSLNLHVLDIDLYGVAIGPGSFTGLRIGLATIKSFAHVFNKPIVGVSTLEGLAFNVSFDGYIVPMIDARRNRVYTGIYRWENGNLNNILPPTTIEIDELLDILNNDYDNIIVNGNGVYIHKKSIKDKLGEKVKIAPLIHNSCRAASIAELAMLNRDGGDTSNYYNLVPEYLKVSQAQQEKNEKERDRQ